MLLSILGNGPTLDPKESADQFLGANLEIGFGPFVGGCYLYWQGQSGNTKDAQFRCGESSGDKFWIKKRGMDYYIGFAECPLYWRGDQGYRKNAEFRCGDSGDAFWIKPEKKVDGVTMWSIGWTGGDGVECPLYWRSIKNDPCIKNAEFLCGKPRSGWFWITSKNFNI